LAAGEADRRPEPVREFVVIIDHRVEPTSTQTPRSFSCVSHEIRRQSVTSVVSSDSQSVEMASPTVPADDDRGENVTGFLGDQQRVGVSFEKLR
jgi:hypothetical protein